MGGKHQTYGAGRESLLGSPDAGWYVKSVERTVQENRAFVDTVIKNDLKAAASCYQKLMTLLMRMGSARLPSRYVIGIEHPFDIKRHLHAIVNRGQAPLSLANCYLGQFYDRTVVYGGLFHCCWLTFILLRIKGSIYRLYKHAATTVIIIQTKAPATDLPAGAVAKWASMVLYKRTIVR